MSGLTPPNVLSYLGQVVVPFINRTFPPQSSFLEFGVPTVWVDTANSNAYILVSKANNFADWVLIGGSPGQVSTLTGDNGAAVPPTGGNIDILGGSTGLTFNGSPSTSTLSLTGTLNVADGGTGDTSLTAYAVMCGGTTSTNPVQSIASVGTSGQVLVSNGAGALPTFQSIIAAGAFSEVALQVKTTTGTYTPTTGMKYCIIEVMGGGGGGGGAVTGSSGVGTAGAGGGAGGYARQVFTAATIGSSQTVTIGAGGTAGANTGGAGGTGGTTSVGSLISATGGTGGAGDPVAGDSNVQVGGVGGVGTGTFSSTGQSGNFSYTLNVSGVVFQGSSGSGGVSSFGFGGVGKLATLTSSLAGNNGSMGGGGGGAAVANNASPAVGGAGGAGYVVITEFI